MYNEMMFCSSSTCSCTLVWPQHSFWGNKLKTRIGHFPNGRERVHNMRLCLNQSGSSSLNCPFIHSVLLEDDDHEKCPHRILTSSKSFTHVTTTCTSLFITLLTKSTVT